MRTSNAFECLTMASLTIDGDGAYCSASIYLRDDGWWDVIVHGFVDDGFAQVDIGTTTCRETRREAAACAVRALHEVAERAALAATTRAA